VPLEATAWADRPRYEVNEPIHLGIKVLNTSKRVVELDYAIYFHTNIHVRVTDQEGKDVEYPDWNISVDVAPKAGLDRSLAFIELKPGYFWGRDDFTEDRLRLSRKGVYTLDVSYGGYAYMFHDAYPGHKVWKGGVHSPPIKVEIVGPGEHGDK
jgi:hypothetical protein